jgi:hypothetical protein
MARALAEQVRPPPPPPPPPPMTWHSHVCQSSVSYSNDSSTVGPCHCVQLCYTPDTPYRDRTQTSHISSTLVQSNTSFARLYLMSASCTLRTVAQHVTRSCMHQMAHSTRVGSIAFALLFRESLTRSCVSVLLCQRNTTQHNQRWATSWPR